MIKLLRFIHFIIFFKLFKSLLTAQTSELLHKDKFFKRKIRSEQWRILILCVLITIQDLAVTFLLIQVLDASDKCNNILWFVRHTNQSILPETKAHASLHHHDCCCWLIHFFTNFPYDLYLRRCFLEKRRLWQSVFTLRNWNICLFIHASGAKCNGLCQTVQKRYQS